MPLPGWYIERLEEEIAGFKAQLEPLEGGKIRLGVRNIERPDLDPTNARIQWLRSMIADYQAMVDRRHA